MYSAPVNRGEKERDRVREWYADACDFSVTPYLSLLCQYHDIVRVLFPDHPPEVIHRVSQRSLSQYVLLTLSIPLVQANASINVCLCCALHCKYSIVHLCMLAYIKVAGIDVVCRIHTVHSGLQTHSVLVICIAITIIIIDNIEPLSDQQLYFYHKYYW